MWALFLSFICSDCRFDLIDVNRQILSSGPIQIMSSGVTLQITWAQVWIFRSWGPVRYDLSDHVLCNPSDQDSGVTLQIMSSDVCLWLMSSFRSWGQAWRFSSWTYMCPYGSWIQTWSFRWWAQAWPFKLWVKVLLFRSWGQVWPSDHEVRCDPSYHWSGVTLQIMRSGVTLHIIGQV